MEKHIGIVACSAEGAALCYRTICLEGEISLGRHRHPEISMHTYPLSEYMKFITSGDWEGVAHLMIGSAKKLALCGADFAICPDNTIHQAFDPAVKQSPIPWLHIADSVVEAAKQNNYSKIALLGTRFLMEGPVYPPRLKQAGLDYEIPNAEERENINDIIFDELVGGKISAESQIYLYHVIGRMKDQGCRAVALCCTELPLIVLPEDSPLPTLDSTRLLARAALKQALK